MGHRNKSTSRAREKDPNNEVNVPVQRHGDVIVSVPDQKPSDNIDQKASFFIEKKKKSFSKLLVQIRVHHKPHGSVHTQAKERPEEWTRGAPRAGKEISEGKEPLGGKGVRRDFRDHDYSTPPLRKPTAVQIARISNIDDKADIFTKNKKSAE